MSSTDPTREPSRDAARIRREPPLFRHVEVLRVVSLGPRMQRITLTGPELDGFSVEEPAASVRVLVPTRTSEPFVLPVWNGNEFLFADGRRPAIRTFTPRHVDTYAFEVDIDAVIHGDGPASEWARTATPGAVAALSGPGRGYTIDRDASAFVLAGDESAIPAISQLLEQLPPATPTLVHIEVAAPDGRLKLPVHAHARVEWHDLPPDAPSGDALVAAMHEVALPAGARVWAAGEAAAMQRIRRHLFEERHLARGQTAIRGYWKHGRAGAGSDDG